MFDSSMSAVAIAARIQELQAAAGIKAQLVNPSGRGAGIITLTGWVALAALVSCPFRMLKLGITLTGKQCCSALRGSQHMAALFLASLDSVLVRTGQESADIRLGRQSSAECTRQTAKSHGRQQPCG